MPVWSRKPWPALSSGWLRTRDRPIVATPTCKPTRLAGNNPYRDTSAVGSANAATMRGQSPWSHQSRYRLYARYRLPYSCGISRHDRSVPTTERIPLSTVRWSCRGRPVGGFCGGRSGAIRTHSASLSGWWVGGSGGTLPMQLPRCCVSARRAAWQRAATAWCARRQRDHARWKGRRVSPPAIARTSRRVSGTVRGIRSGAAPPFPRPAHTGRRGARRPETREPTGRA